jgi:50S ribosomal protein L16 3-hydroxylase
MFCDWLAPDEPRIFLETTFNRAPYARPGAAQQDVPLLGWETLDRVLAAEGPIDVLTVSAGRLVEVPAPRSAEEVRRLMRLSPGISTVVRASERHDAGLAALARSFSEVLPGEVHVQLYATPAGTNSYGWHYDFEDVFIAQTLGVKDYYFRANTVAQESRLGEVLDFSLIRSEPSQLLCARLIAGDWLYLPRRWWHFVRCLEDSLSISVGVMSPEELRSARRLPAGWTGEAGNPAP